MAQANTENFTRLSAGERDVLLCLAQVVNGPDTAPSGQDVAQALDRLRGHRTSDATVYKALSSLVAKGFVDKTDLDSRQNTYQLTDHGLSAVRQQAERFNDAL